MESRSLILLERGGGTFILKIKMGVPNDYVLKTYHIIVPKRVNFIDFKVGAQPYKLEGNWQFESLEFFVLNNDQYEWQKQTCNFNFTLGQGIISGRACPNIFNGKYERKNEWNIEFSNITTSEMVSFPLEEEFYNFLPLASKAYMDITPTTLSFYGSVKQVMLYRKFALN